MQNQTDKTQHMEKIELTLNELEKLNNEITDLLKEKLPVYIKFKLHTLKKKMANDVDSSQTLQKELFEKYGYKDKGVYKIKMEGDNYELYLKDQDELSKQKVSLEYEQFKLSILENVESNSNLDIFFKLIIKDTIQ